MPIVRDEECAQAPMGLSLSYKGGKVLTVDPEWQAEEDHGISQSISLLH